MVIKIIIFGKIYLEERLPDIGKGADTCMQKHPYKIQYHVCNIYCVSETTPFIWPAEKRFEFAMMVKQIILGELCPHLQESSDIWLKRTTPFTSRLMSHAVNRKRKKKKFFVFIDWYLRHKQSPLSATQCSCSFILVLPFTVCPECEFSSSQRSWLNCLFDLTLSELSLSAGSSVTT